MNLQKKIKLEIEDLEVICELIDDMANALVRFYSNPQSYDSHFFEKREVLLKRCLKAKKEDEEILTQVKKIRFEVLKDEEEIIHSLLIFIINKITDKKLENIKGTVITTPSRELLDYLSQTIKDLIPVTINLKKQINRLKEIS